MGVLSAGQHGRRPARLTFRAVGGEPSQDGQPNCDACAIQAGGYFAGERPPATNARSKTKPGQGRRPLSFQTGPSRPRSGSCADAYQTCVMRISPVRDSTPAVSYTHLGRHQRGHPTGAWKAPSERTKASGPVRASVSSVLWWPEASLPRKIHRPGSRTRRK